MKQVLIISLKFNPGHVSHMIASYKQCEALGYIPTYCVHPCFIPFLPEGSPICIYGIDTLPVVELAIFLFPSEKNLNLMWSIRKNDTKIVYIFHEPLSSMKEYRRSGFSYLYLIKLWLINRISSLIVKWSDVILLPSRKAVEVYTSNDLYKNDNYYYLPLMFDDEKARDHSCIERKYFSYIGTVAPDHSFREYLEFVEWAVTNEKLDGISFLIATRSTFEIPARLRETNRVVVCQGTPMTNEQINEYYASSIVIWNAYERTTQSGVLAKSFMFGTPALILKKNENEFAHDKIEAIAINDNSDKQEILCAVTKVKEEFEFFSNNCRVRFLKSFYYKNYNEQFSEIIKNIR